MNRIYAIAAATIFTIVGWASTGHAHGLGLAVNQISNAGSRPIVKVHSPRQVHDMLHADGYHHVVFLGQRYKGYDDRPIYRFRACRRHRAFRITVNWYGEIIRKRRAGRCHRYGQYGGY